MDSKADYNQTNLTIGISEIIYEESKNTSVGLSNNKIYFVTIITINIYKRVCLNYKYDKLSFSTQTPSPQRFRRFLAGALFFCRF